MSVNTYTPDSTKIIHNTSVDFVTRYINTPVHLVQYDNSSPIVAVKLYSNGTPYVIPNGMDVNVRVKKPDGTIVYNHVLGCNADRNEIYFDATTQMCAVDGEIYPVIEITDRTVVAASGYILVQVDKNPVNNEDIKSSSEAKAIDEYVQYAKSWAVGDTGTRVGENTDNSKFYAEQSALNETQASVYASDAARSAINAEDSADNAKASEDNAKASEDASAQSVLDAQAEVRKAEGEVAKAKTEVTAAEQEANKAKGYADNAEANAVIAAHAADSAQTDAINAANSASTAQMYAENAEAIVGIGIATTDKAGILKPDGTSSWVDPDGTLHTAAGEGNMNTKDYVDDTGTGVVRKAKTVGNADTEILEGFSEDPETGHLLYNDKPIASESDGLYTNNKAQYEEDASKVSDGTAVIITDDMDDDEDMSTDYVNPDHFEFQNGVMSLSEKVSAKITNLDDGYIEETKPHGSTLLDILNNIPTPCRYRANLWTPLSDFPVPITDVSYWNIDIDKQVDFLSYSTIRLTKYNDYYEKIDEYVGRYDVNKNKFVWFSVTKELTDIQNLQWKDASLTVNSLYVLNHYLIAREYGKLISINGYITTKSDLPTNETLFSVPNVKNPSYLSALHTANGFSYGGMFSGNNYLCNYTILPAGTYVIAGFVAKK